MKTPFCIMKSSAMSEKSKIQILSQDLIRRMLNVCESVPQSERNKIINNYTDRLARSGYNKNQIKEIIVSGLTGYEKKVAKAARENVPLHRPASATLKSRLNKKLTQRQNWFKGKKNKDENQSSKKPNIAREVVDPPIVSVMFVQQTPHSQLLHQLRLTESKISAVTEDRVKIVERSGTKLKHLLVSSDPWSNTKCNDSKCLVCSNPLNSNFSCRKRNICYKTYCLKCANEAGLDEKSIRKNVNGDIKFYFGETFRDANTRGSEHLSDFKRKSEDSHMMKHVCEDHPGSKDIKFGISVIKKHKSSFERQIFESILIFRGGKNVLNSKSEFSRCVVPRLSAMIGEETNQFEVIYEKKKLNKRLHDEAEANVGYKPPKKRKFKHDIDDKTLSFDNDKIDVHVNTETNDLKEETFPKSSALDENVQADEAIPLFKKSKQRPTKVVTKTSIKGQMKISTFFKNLDGESKPNQENLSAPTAPT